MVVDVKRRRVRCFPPAWLRNDGHNALCFIFEGGGLGVGSAYYDVKTTTDNNKIVYDVRTRYFAGLPIICYGQTTVLMGVRV